jgi:phosphopantothenoylcysteine decarboxylase/phosphopantothenate--cysteine ligase
MKTILLGVTGSVAAYRACDLARDLRRSRYRVRTCLTESAAKFVQPALFEALTTEPCLIDSFEEPERGKMAHIDWAREADLMLVAPATGNFLNKLAAGVADDMLTTLALAFTGPVVVAPAMNPAMYSHESVREALAKLRSRLAVVIEPSAGEVACGENGQGKLASNAEIMAQVQAVLNRREVWRDKKVLSTSGPTHEAIDGVRYIGNRSSGKMGAALARAAQLMGAEVHVVSGPTSVAYPWDAYVTRVNSAEEMLEAATDVAATADLIIGAAAVADYRPKQRLSGKKRRSGDDWNLELVPNPDVLAELARAACKEGKVVAFAAEPGEDLEEARQKMARKKVHAIAVNDVSRSDVGFDSDENELTLLLANGEPVASGKRSKLECALWLLDQLSG